MRVVVIGSGVAGASAAYELARAGAETVLVDAAHEGRATSAGAGIVCPWTGREEEPLGVEGARHYPAMLAALAEDGQTEVGHRTSGALLLIGGPGGADGGAGGGNGGDGDVDGDAAEVEERIRARTAGDARAGQITRVAPEDARELFPALHPRSSALHIPGAARVDGRLLRAALCAAGERHGLRTVEGSARIETGGGRVRGVRVVRGAHGHTGGELLAADAVVAAAGAWVPELLGSLGVEVRVAPQRGQIVHLRLPDADTAAWPVVLPRGTGHYMLAFDDSRIVVGATREDGVGFDPRVTAGGLAEVLDRALTVAPGLARAEHIETRVGFRPVGPDAAPLLGTVPHLDGLVVASGLGSGGLTAGPFAGLVAARLALGKDPGTDLTPYDPLRGPAPTPPRTG